MPRAEAAAATRRPPLKDKHHRRSQAILCVKRLSAGWTKTREQGYRAGRSSSIGVVDSLASLVLGLDYL